MSRRAAPPTTGRRRRGYRLVAAAAAALLGGFVLVPPAFADDGQWWYDFYGVDAIHQQGITGEGVKIAVIDMQINPDLPVFDGADLTADSDPLCVGEQSVTSEYNENSSHGTTITALLIGNGTGAGGIRGIVPDASVTFYGYGDTDLSNCEIPDDQTSDDPRVSNISSWGWAVKRAVADGADIITTSALNYQADSEADALETAKALEQGVIIVAGTPNDSADIALTPWGFRGVVAVSAMDAAGALQTDSVWGGPVVWPDTTVTAAGTRFPSVGADGSWEATGPTTGSSLATPLVAGMLALASQKYPDATADQLLQSLVINTGVDDHPLEHDTESGYGFGFASPNHMLRNDPTQYEDVNPLLDRDAIGAPTDEQFAQARDELAAAQTDPTDATGDPSPAASGITSGLLIGGGAVAVLVVAGAVITIVLIARKNRKNIPRSSS